MPNRLKKCCYCKQRSDQSDMVKHPAGWFCNQDHAVKYSIERGNRLRAKKDDELHKRRKKAFYEKDIKTRREAAVLWFNRYILLRDASIGCVTCGTTKNSIRYHAGHFVSAGVCTALRFDERNVWKQCARCNLMLSGAKSEYRAFISDRLGDDVLAVLEGPQPTIKITAQWYKSIESEYKAKCKQLEARAA